MPAEPPPARRAARSHRAACEPRHRSVPWRCSPEGATPPPLRPAARRDRALDDGGPLLGVEFSLRRHAVSLVVVPERPARLTTTDGPAKSVFGKPRRPNAGGAARGRGGLGGFRQWRPRTRPRRIGFSEARSSRARSRSCRRRPGRTRPTLPRPRARARRGSSLQIRIAWSNRAHAGRGLGRNVRLAPNACSAQRRRPVCARRATRRPPRAARARNG